MRERLSGSAAIHRRRRKAYDKEILSWSVLRPFRHLFSPVLQRFCKLGLGASGDLKLGAVRTIEVLPIFIIHEIENRIIAAQRAFFGKDLGHAGSV